jgi:uncharacterized protein (TIGR02147 family)
MSFRFMARQLGFRAPNHFQLVIQKKRHLSKASCVRMSKILRLEPRQKTYFEILFGLCTERRPSVRDELEARRQRLHSQLRDLKGAQPQLAVLADSLAWYLRMGALQFMGKTASEIVAIAMRSSPFPIARNEVEKALSTLERLGHVRCRDGAFDFDLASIRTGWDMDEQSVKQFHRSNLTLASESVQWPVSNRYLANLSFPANAALYDEAKREIRDLCERLLQKSNATIHSPGDCEQVLSLQFAMFPYFRF